MQTLKFKVKLNAFVYNYFICYMICLRLLIVCPFYLAQEDGAGAGSNLRLYNIVLVSAQVELTVIVLQHSVGWDIRRN